MKRITAVWMMITIMVWTMTAFAEIPFASEDGLAAKPQVVESWKDMRFGMFLCWGPVSLTGEEIGWSRGAPAWGIRDGMRGGRGGTPAEMYDNLYNKWAPDKFDAEQWVKIAKDAGQKYLIFLVKHHDGFCLYDTKLSDYKSTGPESAWKVDVMKYVADACHRHDLKLIVYYSQPDWHHPDYLSDNHDRYIKYLHGQIRELLTNYGKIDGLWFDNLRDFGNSPEAAKLWDAENLFKMARSLQPHLIINDRCGLDADYDTPEQHVGRFQNDRPWESCITLGTQWSWKPNDQLKPYTDAVRMLIVCAIGDGNLALNTNPMPDGRIEPRQVESFQKIGAWLKQYGNSIYGTRGGPFIAPDMDKRSFNSARDKFQLPGGDWWGGSTYKGNTAYLHIMRWPDVTITLPAIDRKLVTYHVLTGGKASVLQDEKGIRVTVAPDHRDDLDTIIKLVFDKSLEDVDPVCIESESVSKGGHASASGQWENPPLGPELAFDNNLSTRWGGAPNTKKGWIAVELDKPSTISHVWISEAYDRIKKFELQIQKDDKWLTVYNGTTVGQDFSATFKPVTAKHIRLNITEATDVPTIWEFRVFK